MRSLKNEYLDCIQIPDTDIGLTKKNAEYFDFPDSQYQLLGKKSMIALCLTVVAFVAYIKINKVNTGALSIVMACLLAGIAFWYQYESRYMRYYKKARKGAKSGALQYSLKFIDKITASNNIYYNNMPSVYMLLKAKALLRKNELVASEIVVEKLISEHPKCFEAWYVKGLCAYMSGEDSVAYEKLSQVSQQRNVSPQIKNCAKSICEELSLEDALAS